MISIMRKGNMWHILRDGKVIGFATTYTLARVKADVAEMVDAH